MGYGKRYAWMPGYHSCMNHVFDLDTNSAICGSPTRPKNIFRPRPSDWCAVDCEKCKVCAEKIIKEANDEQKGY
jgi:hypothetical protein